MNKIERKVYELVEEMLIQTGAIMRGYDCNKLAKELTDTANEIFDIIDRVVPKDLPLGTNILSKFAEGYRAAIFDAEANVVRLKEEE